MKASRGEFLRLIALTSAAGLCGDLAMTAKAVVITPKDSADFDSKYEGTVVADATTEYAISGGGSSRSSDGDIFTFSSSLGSSPIELSQSWTTVADHAGGWTWEMRFKILPTANTNVPNTQIFIGDGAGAGGGSTVFQLFADHIGATSSGSYAVTLDDAFHTLRIAQAGNTSAYDLFIDGDYAVTHDYGVSNPYGVAAYWFGDGSSSVESNIAIDYIRFTGDGGFAPVPEPASLALVVGGLMWMIRRRVAH